MGAPGVARSAAVACSLAVVLAGAGCGASASSSSSSSAPGTATGSSTTSASAATGGATTSSASKSSSATGTSSSTTTAARSRAGRRGRGGGGGSTTTSAASARAGLIATTGYAMYERCAGSCSGSVPAALRRPLRLPSLDGAPCPVTITVDGPVTPSTSTEVGIADVDGSAWMSAPVTWTAAASYTGPILIRGAELGGSDPLGFGTASTPYDELQLLDSGRGAPVSPGRRAWLTETRAQAPGCYAYQVDGTDFSEVIVFRAVG